MKQNKQTLQAVLLLALMVLCLGACKQAKFHIEGTITNAKDSTLYLENMSLSGAVAIDSVTLKEDGNFRFAQKTDFVPEFYRLRIGKQIINLSVDSTETITVKTQLPDMAANYTVEGSENCTKIKELALKQMQLQQSINAIVNDPLLGVKAVQDSVEILLDNYKRQVSKAYIYPAPQKAYAYFALFQSFSLGRLEGLIFNPHNNPDDVKVFAAVATSWDSFYPNSERGENLHNIALEGMKNVRIIRNRQEQTVEVDNVNSVDIIDLALKDNKGATRRLSDLKGKVVLLDFHIFGQENSMGRIMALRDVYNKYHERGFEIYQVSEDTEEHFWKTQTAALPWINVIDMNSYAAMNYNVLEIPTYFLIDRNNTLRLRNIQVTDLDAEIQKLL